MPFVLLPLAIVIVILTLLFVYIQIRRPKHFPPGPKWLPIVGSLPELRRLSILHNGQHEALVHLSKQYSSELIGLRLGNMSAVYVNGYRLVHHVLTSQEFEGRPDSFFIRLRCLGKCRGITCVDGPFWHEQRSFVVKHLKQIGFGRKPMENLVQDEVQDILKLLNTSDPVRFEPIFAPSVINVLWSLTTGSRLCRNDPKLAGFLRLLHVRSKAFDMAGGTLNLFPWLRFIMPERLGYNMLLKLNEQLKDFFVGIIQKHHETWKDDCQDDLIYSFITEMKKEGNYSNFTDDQLIMICLDLFFGGATTTSNTLDFIFLMMVLHPEIQEKAAEYLKEIPSDQPLTYTDRLKLPYLEAIILETERMFALFPIVGPRRVVKDVIIDNYHIPKNTTIFINAYSVHFDSDYWQNPKIFNPERFIKDGKLTSAERVLNFGLGRRRCLGEQLARQCIFIFFANILRKYRICPIPGADLPSAKPIPGISISPEKYQVILQPRHKY